MPGTETDNFILACVFYIWLIAILCMFQLKYAIRMNMSSFLLAVVGLILIGFEIILFLL